MSRICMVTGLAGPGSIAGGVWEVAANQARALTEAGHDVSLVAGWLGERPPRELRGLEVTLVPVRPLVKPLALRALIGRGWKDAVAQALIGSDVAHVHLCRDYLTMAATQVIRRHNVPLIAQTHGMLRRQASPVFKLFDCLVTMPALARIDRFITLTDDETTLLLDLGIDADHTATIENSLPHPQRSWEPQESPMRLLFVSRLHPRKQVLAFAEVVARLCGAGWDVQGIVAGPDQGDLAKLKTFIQSAAYGSAVKYVGELTRDQLLDELEIATALIFPARNEPFGLVLVEAMSVGTPIVSTTETPLAAIMSNATAAVTVAPDINSLLSAVESVLQNSSFRSVLSRNAQELFLANWTNELMVERLIQVYESCQTSATSR